MRRDTKGMQLFSFGTPTTPPTTREDDVAVLRLIRSRRVGPATFYRLLAEHGSLAEALRALPEVARSAGIADYAACPEGVVHAELKAGRRAGARLLRFDDPDYPQALSDLADAPPVLWLRGNISALHRPMIAVVGARSASSLGLRMAHGMAIGLAEAGVTVVAGLARGIDTAAHEATVEAGTVAVMAGGLDRIYPAENIRLAEAITGSGALLSEQAFGTEPAARLFPLRNRIVSGLARGVVVVEAAHRSGTLITASCALDQGREVMAVPGHPMDARASGCNALIRDGATLVRNAADVLAALGIEAGAAAQAEDRAAEAPSDAARPASVAVALQGDVIGALPTVPAPTLTLVTCDDPAAKPMDARSAARRVAETLRRPGALARVQDATRPSPGRPSSGRPAAAPASRSLESRILALLGPSPTDENSLIRDLGLPAATCSAALLMLELSGSITRLPGGKVALTV